MTKLEQSKIWYFDAVVAKLITTGLTKDESEEMVAKYRLKERLEKFPNVQLHYDIDATADEILSM